LEKRNHVKSEWNMCNDRPRKVYKLTTEGQSLLNFTEDSLSLICRKIGTPMPLREELSIATVKEPALHPFTKRIGQPGPTF